MHRQVQFVVHDAQSQRNVLQDVFHQHVRLSYFVLELAALGDVLKNADQTDAFAVAVFCLGSAAHPNAPGHGSDQRQFQVPGLAGLGGPVYCSFNLGTGLRCEESDGFVEGWHMAFGDVVDMAGLV